MYYSTLVKNSARCAALAVLALGALAAGNAGATTSESAFSTTTGGYSQTDQFVGATQLSNNVQSLLLNGGTPGHLSQLGVTVSSTVGLDGAFSFEQNLYRLGAGSANLMTTVTDTITNSSDASVSLRFDSQITPGHIAAQGNDSSNVVFFQFKITQVSGSIDTVLYTANGAVDPNGAPFIQTSDNVAFNGLQSYSNGDQRSLDWSATNLNLALQPIQASSSSIILYQTSTYITGGVACSTLSTCEGTQVAFGDPRNDGGVSNAPQFAAFAQPLGAQPTVPVIGRLFKPYTTYMKAVPIDAPLPPTGPIPEPSTWAIMLLGICGVGSVLRLRRVGLGAL